MNQLPGHIHDLFISYARADLGWVYGYLLPALGLPPDRVVTAQDFAHGVSVVSEFERAVQDSRFTVLVYSPAFPANEWTDFSEQLASHLSVEEQRERVVLLLLQPCEVPLRLKPRLHLDCTEPADWEQQVAQLRQMLTLPEPNPEDIPCPYPGMAPFRQEDAQRFFGREDEIQELRQRLDEQSLILVMGPSGSGKSSLLSAGLIPVLPMEWTCLSMRPGSQPLDALWSALAEISGTNEYLAGKITSLDLTGKRLLLIVDQFEELFSLAARPDQTAFIDSISRLQHCPGCAVILALRADFYPDLMNSPLWPLKPEQRLEVVPLRGESLRPIIQRPANDLRVHLEAGLVERLIADAADEPGVLPLLQQTMVSLWEKRRRRLLPLHAYRAMGDGQRSGLATAVAIKADEAMARLAPQDRTIARRIFLRLVAFGEGRLDTRRQQPISALADAANNRDQVVRVVRHLAQYRLLTLGDKDGEQQTVDIAHDVLITGWPTFGDWIEQWRTAELTRRRLQAKAEEWERWIADGQRNSGLLDSAELTEAEQWLASEDASQLGHSSKLQALVDASRATLKRSKRIRAAVIGVLVTLLIGVLAAITIGQSQLATQRGQAAATAESLARAESYARGTAESEVVVRTTAEANAVAEAQARATAQAVAEQERNSAVSRQLAAQAQSSKNTVGQLDTAVLLATESLRREANPDASLFLQQTLDQLPTPLLRLSFTRVISDAVFSELGDQIAVTTADQHIRIIEIASGEQITDLTTEMPVRQVAFCRRTSQLLVIETDTITLWEPPESRVVQRIPVPTGNTTVRFDSGCRWVVLIRSTNNQEQFEFWDLQNGRQIGVISNVTPFDKLYVSPDEGWLLTATRDVLGLWRPEKAELTKTLQLNGAVDDLGFSNRGKMVAATHGCSASQAREDCHGISVIDLDRQEIVAQLGEPNQHFQAVVFSGDDSHLLGTVGGTYRFDNRELDLFGSSRGTVRDTVPEDIIDVWRTDTWELETSQDIPSNEIVPHPDRPLAVSYSQRIVTVWDIETGAVQSQFDVGSDVSEVSWVANDVPRWVTTIPAGRSCAKERCVDALEVWDVRTGTLVAQLSPPGLGNAFYILDPSRRSALTWNLAGQQLLVWELTPRKQVKLDALTDLSNVNDPVLEMNFSADSAWLAALHGYGSFYVWRLPNDGRTDGTPWQPTTEVSEAGRSFVISADSRWVALASSSEQRIEIRTLNTGEVQFTAPLSGEPIGFSGDGTRLIATDQKEGKDTIVIWDISRASESIRFSAPPLEAYHSLNKAGTRLALEDIPGAVVHVYDLENGKELAQIPAGYWAMNADGTLLAVANARGRKSLQLWSVARNTMLIETDLNDDSSNKRLAFSDNSELIVAGSTLSVRRLPDLSKISAFTLGNAPFRDISPDGKWVFVAQGTGDTYIVDAHTGTRVAKLWIPGSYAYKIAFTQDDERVAVVGVNGEKRVLIWKPESLIAEACARLTRNLTEAEWAIYLPNEPYRKTCPEPP